MTTRSLIPLVFLTLLTAPALPLTAQQGNFGSSVAIAGEAIAVGQPANFYGPGAVYLYRMSGGGVWEEAGRLFAPDSTLADSFGRSLAASSDRVVVGLPREGGGGVAYLFGPGDEDGTWAPVATLPALAGGASAGFGTAVALSDRDAFVGAPDAKGPGAVYHFDPRGMGAATSVLEPTAPVDAGFGSSLSLEGDLLLVGAPAAGSGAGAAVLYHRDPGGAWVEESVLLPDASTAGLFGASVHLSGGRAFVGAPRGRQGMGTTAVYESGESGWSLAGILAPEGFSPGSAFGSAVHSVGGEVWVGAPNGGGGDGVVHRFRQEDGGTWTRVGEVLPDSANTAAWPFGFGSAIAAGSDLAVVGMPTRDFGEGRAAILRPDSDGSWDESATVLGEIATAVSAIEEGADCEDGSVEIFECNNMEVVSFTPVNQLGGARGVWVNDVWGWTDPV
ncbi:MAG: hypothetical protein OEO23_02530, partial [Gemmatimonadota bacterium]|nr:hypothetical protein [Gemmatimonadota bacterium]